MCGCGLDGSGDRVGAHGLGDHPFAATALATALAMLATATLGICVERMAYRLGLPPPRFALPHQLAYTWAALRESAARFGNDTVGPPDGLSRFSIRQMCTSTYFSIEAARRGA